MCVKWQSLFPFQNKDAATRTGTDEAARCQPHSTSCHRAQEKEESGLSGTGIRSRGTSQFQGRGLEGPRGTCVPPASAGSQARRERAVVRAHVVSPPLEYLFSRYFIFRSTRLWISREQEVLCMRKFDHCSLTWWDLDWLWREHGEIPSEDWPLWGWLFSLSSGVSMKEGCCLFLCVQILLVSCFVCCRIFICNDKPNFKVLLFFL